MQFKDLVFRPHTDGQPGHLQALHTFPDDGVLSVTRWNRPHRYHGGDADRPYEVLLPDGELREYQTVSDIDELLADAIKAPSRG